MATPPVPRPPALLTTLGKLANFSTGEDTRTLNFFLEVSSGDLKLKLKLKYDRPAGQLLTGEDTRTLNFPSRGRLNWRRGE